MKKGVKVYFYLICIVMILVMSSLSVIAFTGGDAGTGGTTTVDYVTPLKKGTPSATPLGYWFATDVDGQTKYYLATSSYDGQNPKPLMVDDTTYTYVSQIFQDPTKKNPSLLDVRQGKTIGSLEYWELPVTKLYTVPYFSNLKGKAEIQSFTFVLAPQVYTQDDLTTTTSPTRYGSHGGEKATFDMYGTKCVISYIDKLSESIPVMPDDASCIQVDILNRKTCTEMADYNVEFCEGITDIGANKKGLVDITIKSGLGGCQEYVDGRPSLTTRTYGRDWFDPKKTAGTSILAKNYLGTKFIANEKKIGLCCGNDLEDEGALAKDSATTSGFSTLYLCAKESTKSGLHDFKWKKATTASEPFNITPVNLKVDDPAKKDGLKLHALSNAENWFVCSDEKQSDNYYKRATVKDGEWTGGGPLLSEYNLLPKPDNVLISEGTSLDPSQSDKGTGGVIDNGKSGGGNSDQDSVDENQLIKDINSVTGGGKTTSCDKDGDGYDGKWWSKGGNPPAGFTTDKTTNKCDTPKPPYDCYDDPNAKLPDDKPSRVFYPGAPNYCDKNGTDIKMDCGTSGTSCLKSTTSVDSKNPKDPTSAKLWAPGFMCHNVNGTGDFAECCGYSLKYCLNFDKGRRQGSPIHTLYDFSFHAMKPTATADEKKNRANKNYVLRYSIRKPPINALEEEETYRLGLKLDEADNYIQDWWNYQYLEMYVWLAANYELDIWIGKYVQPSSISKDMSDTLQYYKFPFKAKLTDYVVNDPGLGKWMHVMIPVGDIFDGNKFQFTPDMILFSSDVKTLQKIGTTVTLNSKSSVAYSNVVGIDKIHLRPRLRDLKPLNAKVTPENYFCSGTWPPRWVSDLDSTFTVEGEEIGKAACNAIPSYTWTGSKCCGDDTGSDAATAGITNAKKEFFADSSAGCWGGESLVDDERAMVVEYKISDDLKKTVRTCRNSTCLYELPRKGGVVIENLHPETYKMSIVNGGNVPIGAKGITTNKHSSILAHNVPVQVLYSQGKFYTCNGAKYLFDMKDDAGKQLIDKANQMSSCQAKGSYFCSHINGTNEGWSSESLFVYPGKGISDMKNNLKGYDDDGDGKIDEDGNGYIPLQSTQLNATFRTSTAKSYNLVGNPSFERK